LLSLWEKCFKSQKYYNITYKEFIKEKRKKMAKNKSLKFSALLFAQFDLSKASL